MKVFIGCSSSKTIDDKYLKLAYDIADTIANQNNTLVYGCASYSMMGKCYEAFKNNNKDVIGIIADKYKEDLKNLELTESYITKTTLERIAKIYETSDIFVIIPGGVGTLEELFSIIEENRTNTWKKLIIYNYEGFYDFLIKWLEMNIKTGFINQIDFDRIKIVSSLEHLDKELGE